MITDLRVIGIDTDGCSLYSDESGDIWNAGIHFLESDW